MDTVQWEATDSENKQSVVAAVYRNQADEAERKSLYETDSTGELHALRNERRRAAMEDDEDTKKRSKMPRNFMFYVLLAAFFYVLWLFMQR